MNRTRPPSFSLILLNTNRSQIGDGFFPKKIIDNFYWLKQQGSQLWILLKICFQYTFIIKNKGSLSTMVKLWLCGLIVKNSNRKNSLLQCRVRLRKIDPMWSNPSSGPCIGGNFVHRTVRFFFYTFIIKRTFRY